MSNSCDALTIKQLLAEASFDENRFTGKQLAEIWEVFKVFDVHADMNIHVRHIAVALRALGRLPSEQYIKDINEKYGGFNKGNVTFIEFLLLLGNESWGMAGSQAELRSIFRGLFDRRGKGWLLYSELRYLLLRVGDVLSEEEVNKIFKIHPPDQDGNIRYIGIIHTLLE